MSRTDQIISALYLARTDNREKMLSDLILKVLFDLNEPMTIEEILLFVKDIFHLEPIRYEVEQRLNSLAGSKEIDVKDDKYFLLEKSQSNIHKLIVEDQGRLERRKQTFTDISKSFFPDEIDDLEIETIWKVFNEYLIDCFLVFGKKAINIFLPYTSDSLADDDAILDTAYQKLGSQKLIIYFKKLIFEYPERLTDVELTYLTHLAFSAERFYSLGVPQEDYEKIKNIQIKDLTVFVDTNILYTVLDFHITPERSAVFELVRIAKENQVDLRLVYLPKTFSELQKARKGLEESISRENFTTSQINALLKSKKLDSFARQFYENKLANSELPYPSDKIAYATALLKEKEILLYNNTIPNLEDEASLFEKIQEYRAFEQAFNRMYDEQGIEINLHKDFERIQHDVFLREVVRDLKGKQINQDEFKFICLTLDRNFLTFDRYSQRNEFGKSYQVAYPNCISPALFLKRIRPFIPLVTTDYKKAFLTSLTAPSFDKDEHRDSLLIQKSVTYFKDLGIEDEDTILNLIKRDLFLEDFAKYEAEDNAAEFIKSEVDKEISILRTANEELKASLTQHGEEQQGLVVEKEAEQSKLQAERSKLQTELSERDSQISSLGKSLQDVLDENRSIKNQLTSIQQETAFERALNNWNQEKDEFINQQTEKEIPKLRENRRYFLKIALITILPIVITMLLNAIPFLKSWIDSLGTYQWFIWGTVILFYLIELFGRAYIFDKDKIREGFNWFTGVFSNQKRREILEAKKDLFEKMYLSSNTLPVRENFLLEESSSNNPLH